MVGMKQKTLDTVLVGVLALGTLAIGTSKLSSKPTPTPASTLVQLAPGDTVEVGMKLSDLVPYAYKLEPMPGEVVDSHSFKRADGLVREFKLIRAPNGEEIGIISDYCQSTPDYVRVLAVATPTRMYLSTRPEGIVTKITETPTNELKEVVPRVCVPMQKVQPLPGEWHELPSPNQTAAPDDTVAVGDSFRERFPYLKNVNGSGLRIGESTIVEENEFSSVREITLLREGTDSIVYELVSVQCSGHPEEVSLLVDHERKRYYTSPHLTGTIEEINALHGSELKYTRPDCIKKPQQPQAVASDTIALGDSLATAFPKLTQHFEGKNPLIAQQNTVGRHGQKHIVVTFGDTTNSAPGTPPKLYARMLLQQCTGDPLELYGIIDFTNERVYEVRNGFVTAIHPSTPAVRLTPPLCAVSVQRGTKA
jgi:hypothetical protein